MKRRSWKTGLGQLKKYHTKRGQTYTYSHGCSAPSDCVATVPDDSGHSRAYPGTAYEPCHHRKSATRPLLLPLRVRVQQHIPLLGI